MPSCTNCGKTASIADRFCRSCRTPIRSTSLASRPFETLFYAMGGRRDARRRVVLVVAVVAVILVAITVFRMFPLPEVSGFVPGVSGQEYYVMFALALLIGGFGLFIPVGGKRRPRSASQANGPVGLHNVKDAVAVNATLPKFDKPESLQSQYEAYRSIIPPPRSNERVVEAPINLNDTYGDSFETLEAGKLRTSRETSSRAFAVQETQEPVREGEANETPVTLVDGEGKEGVDRLRTLLRRIQQLERERDRLKEKLWNARGSSSRLLAVLMLAIGAITLASSVVYTNTVLAFIGLGLSFWGGLLIGIRPAKYVKTELVASTGLSSITSIDRVLGAFGYSGRGVYLPAKNLQGTVVFVSAEDGTAIPSKLRGKGIFVDSPKGAALIPPGLSLATLIESELGTDVTKLDFPYLQGRLAKVLIEDLEIVRDFEMVTEADRIRFKFRDAIYSDFSNELRANTRICSTLGCPICSAIACILAGSTRKRIAFEGESLSADGHIMEASYRIIQDTPQPIVGTSYTCRACGNETKQNDQFCGKCGSSLTA